MINEEITPKYSVLPREFIESPNTTMEEIKLLSYIVANKGKSITHKGMASALGITKSRVSTCLKKLAKKNILVMYGAQGSMKTYRVKALEMWVV